VGESVELGEGLVRVLADLMRWDGDEAIEIGVGELGVVERKTRRFL